VRASLPSLQDNTADADRLRHALAVALQLETEGKASLLIPYAVLAEVASGFRSAGFKGAAVINMMPSCIEVVDFLPALPSHLPAIALDLGTTHLEATLIDLLTGNRMASGHTENRQAEYGSDILSRIHFAGHAVRSNEGKEGRSGLARLQASVITSVTQLIEQLAADAGCRPSDIRAMSVSGNTTMAHLFLGLSPHHICREPYIPLVNSPDPCHAADLSLPIAQQAPVWIMPSIGSYFGGDLVSGILATGLDESDKTAMLIDVGTNAEVVLGSRDWLIACAGAAGPALEGGVARMGMRAGPGAVEHVSIDRSVWQLSCQTIGNTPALGLCGSGLIDLVAELYLSRIIDFRGKFRREPVSESAAHEHFLRQRIIEDETGCSFLVVAEEKSATGTPVLLSQTDLDALMRSKAAMYAILTTLVSQVGVAFEELDKIYVAGAFGRHIDPYHAITIGMLPDLPLTTYEPVGNSSLLGAERVLLSAACRKRSMDIQRKITYLELNVNQEFMLRFSGARCIPHADPSLFPSVPHFQADTT